MRKISDTLSFIRYGPYLIFKHIWIQALILALMFFAAALIFHQYQGLDWLSALLGAVSTITTIGIYAPNIVVMPSDEKVFLIVVFIASVGAAASLVQSTVTSILRRELFMEEMDELKAKGMEGHVIIMGYSFLGKYVIEKLKDLGLSSVVVTREESQTQIARKKGNIVLTAPVTHMLDALRQAGIRNAFAVVATYDNDGDNLMAVMAAKKLNPAVRVITILNEKELREEAKAAQADVVITPSDIMGQILAVSTVSSEIAGVFTSDRLMGKGIAEFEIKRADVKLGELERVCPVLLIIRKGNILSNVGREFQLEKGDVVCALTDHKLLVKFRALVQGENV